MAPWQKRFLGILAIGGGFLGATATLSEVSAQYQTIGGGIVLLFGFFALYAWGVWCGVLMLEDAPNALSSNRWFWATQIPIFISPFLGYAFASGFFLNVWLRLPDFNLGFNFLLGSKFEYHFMQSDQPWVLGLNVFALAIFLFLSRAISRRAL
jgi:hypothetical protein